MDEICEALICNKVDSLQKILDGKTHFINENIEIPIDLVRQHAPNMAVICSIRGEDTQLPLLHIAAATNSIASINWLLDMNFYVDHQCSFTQSTALCYAAHNGNLEAVTCLTGRQCDVNRISGNNISQENSKHFFCTSCDKLKNRNYLHKQDSGYNATYQDNNNRPEHVDICNSGGATALVLAASNPSIVLDLLQHGAKVNTVCEYERGTLHVTALGAAIKAVAPESVELLLEAGASVFDVCEFNHNHTAIDMAICYSKYPSDETFVQKMLRIVDLLLFKGADPNIISHEKTLLQNLVVADRTVDVLLMRKLHKAGAYLEKRCKPSGHTTLTEAIAHGRTEQVQWLLECNCRLEYYVTLNKGDIFEQTETYPTFNPIELSVYLCEKDIEWATTLASWDSDFFLFLTRQLSITEMLILSGLRPPKELGAILIKYNNILKNSSHFVKPEVKRLYTRLEYLLLLTTNPLSLKDTATNSIRRALQDKICYTNAIYNLNLPPILVDKYLLRRLDHVPLPKRTR